MATTVTTTGITFNDATTQTTAAGGVGVFENYAASGASGTWTVPAGVTRACFLIIGGGAGKGGQYGGAALLTHVVVTPAQVITYAIGAGGSSTGNGGNSTVTIAAAVYATAYGGISVIDSWSSGNSDNHKEQNDQSYMGKINSAAAQGVGGQIWVAHDRNRRNVTNSADSLVAADASNGGQGTPVATLAAIARIPAIFAFFNTKTYRRPAGNGTSGVAWSTASTYIPGAGGTWKTNANDAATNISAGIGGAFFAIY
jgi:hypothetical protein